MSAIEVKNLSLIKRKGSKRHTLLNNISLSIPTGKITLLLGKSGAGKTSILRCISQIENKYVGEVFADGKSLSEFPRRERCQIIGFVPQSYALFPFMNVLNNCAHPLRVILGYNKKSADQKVKEALSSFGMERLIHSYPHELSGGQQQRTSIIRALLLNPTFLLLDEPTSALDPENSNFLIQIILKLKAEGKAIAISSQDMLFARKILDRVYFVEQGALIENHDFDRQDLRIPKESRLSEFFLGTEVS